MPREQAVVFVGNLPLGCTGRQLLRHFSQYASCIRQKAKIFETQHDSSAYSFLYFDTDKKAFEAIREMNDSLFLGKKLRLAIEPFKKLCKPGETYQLLVKLKRYMATHNMESHEEGTFSVNVGDVQFDCMYQPHSIPFEEYGQTIFKERGVVMAYNTNRDSQTLEKSTVSVEIRKEEDEFFTCIQEKVKKNTELQKVNQSNSAEEMAEKVLVSVAVNDLPSECTSDQLLECFSDFLSAIDTKKVEIFTKKCHKTSLSYAFLTFDSLEKAEEAIRTRNKKTIYGKRMSAKLHIKPNKTVAHHPQLPTDSVGKDQDYRKLKKNDFNSKCNQLPRNATPSHTSSSLRVEMTNSDGEDTSCLDLNAPMNAQVTSELCSHTSNHLIPTSQWDTPILDLSEYYSDDDKAVPIKHSIGDSPLEPPYIQPPSNYITSKGPLEQISSNAGDPGPSAPLQKLVLSSPDLCDHNVHTSGNDSTHTPNGTPNQLDDQVNTHNMNKSAEVRQQVTENSKLMKNSDSKTTVGITESNESNNPCPIVNENVRKNTKEASEKKAKETEMTSSDTLYTTSST